MNDPLLYILPVLAVSAPVRPILTTTKSLSIIPQLDLKHNLKQLEEWCEKDEDSMEWSKHLQLDKYKDLKFEPRIALLPDATYEQRCEAFALVKEWGTEVIIPKVKR